MAFGSGITAFLCDFGPRQVSALPGPGVAKKQGESISNNFCAPCGPEKAEKLRGRGSRSSHYHRCCPMCCIALFCCKRLCANHLVNKLRAEVARTQKNWGASNVQLWNLDFRKAAIKKLKPTHLPSDNLTEQHCVVHTKHCLSLDMTPGKGMCQSAAAAQNVPISRSQIPKICEK